MPNSLQDEYNLALKLVKDIRKLIDDSMYDPILDEIAFMIDQQYPDLEWNDA